MQFIPENFNSVLAKEDLIEILEELIINIRKNSLEYTNLINAIKKLEEYQEQVQNLNKTTDLNLLFIIYEKIKSASMEMRKLLSNFIDLDTYDSIGYAFYYNNQRFTTEKLDASWLVRGSRGELSLDLDKAIADLKQETQDKADEQVQEIFNRHYQSYLNAISGTYKGIMGRKLNKGYIAEAYEEHLAIHHTTAYNLFNKSKSLSVLDKGIMITTAIEDISSAGNWWASHESMSKAWSHITSSMGRQRGTVAGDVGRVQVKSGYSYSTYGRKVRLASLATLKDGVQEYCDILNLNKSAKEVAILLASYLTEPVKSTEQNLQAFIANKELKTSIEELGGTKLVHI